MCRKLLNGFKHLKYGYRCSYLSQQAYKSNETFNTLKSKIKLLGPMTVHDYMREVLTNPRYGYYTNKVVFGKSGDFITSPEISQIFGEMIAIWTISEWKKVGAPRPLQLVELGPGRGTMMRDMLRVFSRLKVPPDEMSVHLIEVSNELRRLQAKNLCETMQSHDDSNIAGITANGVPVFWHTDIQQLPQQFSCILAHEFFDALPVHILKKTEKGWREVLVDIDESEKKFHFVLSPSITPACVYYKYANGRDHFEVSPHSGVIMEQISKRLEEFGGFALVLDYGHEGNKTDTFRGFREHKVTDPLADPGLSDLTADVDFAFLQAAVGERLISFGPVTQRHFLTQLHINVRLQMLLKNCPSDEVKSDILSGYHMIMDTDKMGEAFKVMSFFPAVLQKHLQQFPVAGFV